MFYFDKVLEKEVLKSDKIPVNHFFTTRELILKTKEDDFILEAEKNRELIKKEFNLKYLVFPSQKHTSNVEFFEPLKTYDSVDSIILDNLDAGIFLNFADCTPVILYDKKERMASIAHAGWRGTVSKIVQKTLLKMNSNPKDITALIGPSICFDCFETSEEIMRLLISTISDSKGACKVNNGKFYADLKEINKRQLNELSVFEIDIAPFCTCCNNDKFFSYRKENKTTNRMSAFICLK